MVQLNVPGVREEIEEDVLNGSPHRLSQGVFPSARRSWTFRR